MPDPAARLIAYGFVGAFAAAGLLLLAIAATAVVQRAAFLHAALRTDGTVVALRAVHSTRTGAGTEVPVFRFTATDGRPYTQAAEASVRGASLRVGQRIGVF
jgi:hypothetical protein